MLIFIPRRQLQAWMEREPVPGTTHLSYSTAWATVANPGGFTTHGWHSPLSAEEGCGAKGDTLLLDRSANLSSEQMKVVTSQEDPVSGHTFFAFLRGTNTQTPPPLLTQYLSQGWRRLRIPCSLGKVFTDSGVNYSYQVFLRPQQKTQNLLEEIIRNRYILANQCSEKSMGFGPDSLGCPPASPVASCRSIYPPFWALDLIYNTQDGHQHTSVDCHAWSTQVRC